MEDENRLLRNSMPAHEVRQRFAEFHAATGIHPGERGDRGHDLGEAGKAFVQGRGFLFSPDRSKEVAVYNAHLMGEDRQDRYASNYRSKRTILLSGVLHKDGTGGVSMSAATDRINEDSVDAERSSVAKFTKKDRDKVEKHIAAGSALDNNDTLKRPSIAENQQSHPEHFGPQFVRVGMDRNYSTHIPNDVWDTHNDDWAKIDPSGPYFPT